MITESLGQTKEAIVLHKIDEQSHRSWNEDKIDLYRSW